MTKLKDYLVVTELNCTGFIIGSFNSFAQAEKVSKDLLNKYEHLYKQGGQELYEKTMNYTTYKVHPTCKYSFQSVNQSCGSGTYSTYIVCTDREGFSLEQLILDRGNTIYLFDVEDYDQDTKRFVKFCPNLIAN
jgi:hypothetical protein